MVKTSTPLLGESNRNKVDKKGQLRINEKGNEPATKPRFSRKLASSTSKERDGPEVVLKVANESDVCQQLLVEGYVQSYVDFYHLTHRADPNSTTGHKVSRIHTSVEDMSYIKENLVNAEKSRRSGNTSGVYTAYNKLADMYMQQMDWKTSIFFHEKCLEVAQLTADMRAEMAANHSLGCVYQKMEDFEMAQKHHERHEAIAVSIDLLEEVAKANVELYKVYMVLAGRLESEISSEDGGTGSINDALAMYQKCLTAAQKCWDKTSEGEANGKIGNLYLRNGKPDESLPYLRNHSQISADLGDAESRCRACSALALALDTLGLADKALVELKLVHSISEQAGDAILQSQACRALGTLYSKVGKLEESVQVLQRHFELLKSLAAKDKAAAASGPGGVASIGDNKSTAAGGAVTRPGPVVKAKDLDLARVFVGVSKGNLLLGAYCYAIECDLSYLLEWKLTRAELPRPQHHKGGDHH